MLHLVHASRFHWGVVGTPANQAIGDWQISRAYALVGQPNLALRFAKSSLEICRRNSLFGLTHTAHEAMARACAVAKDYPAAKRYLDKARRQLADLDLDEGDRATYAEQIRETETLIKNR